MPNAIALTQEDRRFLHTHAIGWDGDEREEPDERLVVGIKQYMAAVDSADYILRENRRLRRHGKKLHGLARRSISAAEWWRMAAVAMGVGLVVVIVGKRR